MVQFLREKSELCFWINLKFAIFVMLENITGCIMINSYNKKN